MHPKKRSELLQKGWAEKDLQKAEDILEKTSAHEIFFSKIIFWSALVVIVFANLLVSFVLIPFLIVLSKWILIFTIVVMAGVIGFLYNFLILDIKHLEKKHHLAAAVIIPVIALANVFLMVIISNKFIADLQVDTPPHNPAVVGIVFGVAFILPYIVDRLKGKHYFRHKVQ